MNDIEQTAWSFLFRPTSMVSIAFRNGKPILLESNGKGTIFVSIYRKNRWSWLGLARDTEDGWQSWPCPDKTWVVMNSEQEAIDNILERA